LTSGYFRPFCLIFRLNWPRKLAAGWNFRLCNYLPKAIKGLAELKLEPLAWAGEEESRPAIPVSGDLNLSYSDGSLTINKLNLALLNSQLEVGGRLELPEKISGKLVWRLDDLKAVIQAAKSSGLQKLATGLEQQLSILEGASGSVHLETRVSGKLSRPQFDLALSGQDLKFRQVSLPLLEIKADGSLQKINLSQFLARLDRGQDNRDRRSSGTGWQLGGLFSSLTDGWIYLTWIYPVFRAAG